MNNEDNSKVLAGNEGNSLPGQDAIGTIPNVIEEYSATHDQALSQESKGLSSNDGMPKIASDVDLIEKEWVTAVENITSKYAEDPFTQQEELGKLKLGYIKKRYGKIVGSEGGQ